MRARASSSPGGRMQGESAVTTEGGVGGFYRTHLCLLATKRHRVPTSAPCRVKMMGWTGLVSY